MVIGTGDPELLSGLITGTSLSLIVLEKDPSRIYALRKYFDDSGTGADRLHFMHFDPFSLPKYFSSLTIVNDPGYLNGRDPSVLSRIYESTRPYGGRIWINGGRKARHSLGKMISRQDFYGAEMTGGHDYLMISRAGA